MLAGGRNVAMAQVFENVLGESLAELMAASVGKGASMLMDADESQAMQASVAALMHETAVVKVKIYNRLGVTIFSTDPSQFGESQLGNAGFKSALAGEVRSDLSHRDSLATFDGVRPNIDLLASHVPISSEGRAVEGVFEDAGGSLGGAENGAGVAPGAVAGKGSWAPGVRSRGRRGTGARTASHRG